jgi:hypothetical protein
VQICGNLTARIAEAEQHRWLGEADGLKVSLACARAKLAQMDEITGRRGQARRVVRHATHVLTGLGDDAFTVVAQPAAPTTIAR